MSRTRLILLTVLIAFIGWFFWGLYASARQAELNKRLVTAVDVFDAAAVKRLLAEGADPNTREGGDPPLSWRERFLSTFANHPKHKRFLGTPIIVKAACGPPDDVISDPNVSVQIVSLLVATGANVNARNDIPPPYGSTTTNTGLHPGSTAIIEACDDNRGSFHAPTVTPVEKLLLDAGANVNAADDHGETALAFAAGGNTPLVEALLKRRANVDIRFNSLFCGESCTPLMQSALYDKPEITRLLIDQHSLEERNSNDQTPLMIAAMWNSLLVARVLVGQGADVNARSSTSDTVLILAAQHSGPDFIRLLTQHGVEIGGKDIAGITPLMEAAEGNRSETTRLLIARGADVNACDNNGMNALMYAVDAPSPKIVSILIAHGADIAAHDHQDDTALWLAHTLGNGDSDRERKLHKVASLLGEQGASK